MKKHKWWNENLENQVFKKYHSNQIKKDNKIKTKGVKKIINMKNIKNKNKKIKKIKKNKIEI